ncbi:hypothetical protein Hamer_G023599 [Homarus americanus]|uniref:Uncharacterized protein n=1 Tax=Homarus americanus TaxID=6706 RepID=A0A8J5K662_HOMAM|nr:hypothetical protein Hamer_G023599 [Homarus americanus]
MGEMERGVYEVEAAMIGEGETPRRDRGCCGKWCRHGFSFWCKKYFWEGQLKQGAGDEGYDEVSTAGPFSKLSPIKRMTSVGGGAIAFPVMTLVMNETPAVARDLSSSIQANGMIAASFSILYMKVHIEKQSLLYSFLGSCAGVIFGLEVIDPILTPSMKKMGFVSEKVATPTSVVLMALSSVVCWAWRSAVTQEMPQESWDYLFALIPVVTIGAPFGALIGTHFHRLVLAAFVYILNTVSLIGAFLIVPQTPALTGGSVGVIVGMFFFFSCINKLGDQLNAKHEKLIPNKLETNVRMIKVAAK